MKKIIIILLLIAWALPARLDAQTHYAQVLKDVEANNPVLLAARKRAEAQQTAAHVGALLPNPEVEAAYYWGDPSSVGIRWDLGISQSFEMPSVMVRRARLRKLQEQAAGLDYQVVRNATLLEAQLTCADIIYYRALGMIYTRRCQAAIRIADLYQRRYAAGDCSILDYNRAQMNLADVQNRAAEINLQGDHAVHDLQRLVGGESYLFYQSEYEEVRVETSFESWYEQLEMQNPSLRLLDNQVEAARYQRQLSRAQWLPEMSVGYASENVVGQTFRGVKVGLSLPIWSQQRAVKASRLAEAAATEELSSQRTEWFSRLQCMFHRHEALIRNVGNLREAFQRCNSIDLLDKALDAGEISLEQYLLEADYYYNIEMQIWDVAHELEQLHLHLYSITL
jgi:outer membrane protein TolC